MPDSLWSHGLQHARLLRPPLSPRVCSNSRPLSQWFYLTNHLNLHFPLLLLPLIFPSIRVFFPVSQLFASDGQRIGASASASVLSMNIQGWFPYDRLLWSPCDPRDSQESSPAPQFESINSLVFSLFHGPSLTSIHGYLKNHSFEHLDPCW